ncbi:Secreted RxLR effector peptide protein [Phytophthora palmivora]|uniref:RxLR effector protein n=1 Tax=Phytophthora palmivora TaxID=4796 RepID=A0A2P4WZG1_9STRA|nr:Secreted RxLR effector peptide protein [Phytophthora palmivora]
MRFIYILALVIATTLHTSGTALPATKDSKATIEKVASTVIVGVTRADDGRQLRVDKYANKEDEVEEERLFSNLASGCKSKQQTGKRRDVRRNWQRRMHVSSGIARMLSLREACSRFRHIGKCACSKPT